MHNSVWVHADRFSEHCSGMLSILVKSKCYFFHVKMSCRLSLPADFRKEQRCYSRVQRLSYLRSHDAYELALHSVQYEA